MLQGKRPEKTPYLVEKQSKVTVDYKVIEARQENVYQILYLVH